MEKVLPTREELVAQNYPYGMSAPGIPMGNPEVEWQRSQPDVVVYRPQMPAYDGDNEHFLVFESSKWDGLLAIWTQSSCEGHGDNHIMFSRSDTSQTQWEKPRRIAGKQEDGAGVQVSWAFPVVSRGGRIYVFAVHEIPHDKLQGYDAAQKQSSGNIVCLYSDDCGDTWSPIMDIQPVPRTCYDHENPLIPPAWIVFQPPIRDRYGRFFAGYTRWSNASRFVKHSNAWVNDDSHCFFLRFENIDEDPAPQDIRITWLPEDSRGICVPNPVEPQMETAQEPAVALLPDGRLFCVMRTMTGSPYYVVSADDGCTWSSPEPLRYRDGGERILHPMSPCPLYRMDEKNYLFLFHNNDGNRLWFHQSDLYWMANYANYLRNPMYISIAQFAPNDRQPLRFGEPVEFLNTDDVAIGPKKTAEIGTYPTFTNRNGKWMLWYPDRKYYLLGKQIPEFL